MVETNRQFSDIYQGLTEMASQNEKKPLNPVGFLAYSTSEGVFLKDTLTV